MILQFKKDPSLLTGLFINSLLLLALLRRFNFYSH